MVFISARASKELKDLGCGGPNFLRVSRKIGRNGGNGGYGCFIDSTLVDSDEVIRDGDLRVVADPCSAPFLRNLSIDFDRSGIRMG